MYTLLTLLQLPPGTQNPDDNGPIDFSSAFDVIVFIVLPILLLVFYFYWRRKQRKRDRD
ncbi:MAG: adenylosuccinate synthetase [Gelidibacter sp.]